MGLNFATFVVGCLGCMRIFWSKLITNMDQKHDFTPHSVRQCGFKHSLLQARETLASHPVARRKPSCKVVVTLKGAQREGCWRSRVSKVNGRAFAKSKAHGKGSQAQDEAVPGNTLASSAVVAVVGSEMLAFSGAQP